MQIKGVLINVISSYAHIILSVILNIMYVPLALQFMGVEKYGVWLVLQTFLNYLTLASFSIPSAVTNLMTQSNNYIEKTAIFVKGFKILAVICCVVLLLSAAIYLLISYYTLWLNNISFEIKISGIILMAFFILRIPFQISSAAFISDKKLYIAKFYELTVVVITFLSLLTTIYFNQSIIFLSLLTGVLLLSLQVTSYLNALFIINKGGKKEKSVLIKNKEIYIPGLSLFASSLGSIIIWNTDNLVISKFLDFHEVAVYSTTFRLFSIGLMSFGLIHGVVIPYYGEYFKLKMWDKLDDLFNLNIITIPFLAAWVWLIIWLFSRDIIILWLGNDLLYGNSNLFFILGAYGFSFSFIGVMFNLLSSLNQLKSLFYITIGEATINLIASITLVQKFGIAGVATGTLLASIIVPLIVLPFLINKNKVLEFSFPFKSFLGSLIFYTIILLILFFTKQDILKFTYKIWVACFVLTTFILFQYLLNKKIILKVYEDLKFKKD